MSPNNTLKLLICAVLLLVHTACDGTRTLSPTEQNASAPKLPTKPEADLEYSARWERGVLSSHRFVLKVWHQHPGTLHNGTLEAHLSGEIDSVKPNSIEKYSFDEWPPNEENARTFTFEIKRIDAELKLDVKLLLTSEEIRPTVSSDVWKGSLGWEENK